MTRLNEKEIVNLFVSKLTNHSRIKTKDEITHIGHNYSEIRFGNDDVSVIPFKKKLKRKFKLILKCDMLVESTDAPPAMKPWQIARKSIVSCVSDFSAKGIKPSYLSLISIGIPPRYSKNDILELVRGFKISSKEFGVIFVGGDTNETNELIIDCSMVGFSENDNIPSRSGAAPGDLIVVSGEFGYSASGLKILTGARAGGYFKNKAISSVVTPKPQQKFGTSLAKYFSSSIDSSDGLAVSLYELAIQSGVNFIIDKVPSAKGVERFTKDNEFLDSRELIFHGGEEYHIVATVPSKNMKRIKYIAEKLRLSMFVIGKVTKGNGKVFTTSVEKLKKKYVLLDNRGFLHLTNKEEDNR
ncbi:thiamine-phosphate kinase [soil metagenome]